MKFELPGKRAVRKQLDHCSASNCWVARPLPSRFCLYFALWKWENVEGTKRSNKWGGGSAEIMKLLECGLLNCGICIFFQRLCKFLEWKLAIQETGEANKEDGAGKKDLQYIFNYCKCFTLQTGIPPPLLLSHYLILYAGHVYSGSCLLVSTEGHFVSSSAAVCGHDFWPRQWELARVSLFSNQHPSSSLALCKRWIIPVFLLSVGSVGSRGFFTISNYILDHLEQSYRASYNGQCRFLVKSGSYQISSLLQTHWLPWMSCCFLSLRNLKIKVLIFWEHLVGYLVEQNGGLNGFKFLLTMYGLLESRRERWTFHPFYVFWGTSMQNENRVVCWVNAWFCHPLEPSHLITRAGVAMRRSMVQISPNCELIRWL